MKTIGKTMIPALCLWIWGCGGLKQEYPKAFQIVLENPREEAREDACVELDLRRIREMHPDFNPKAFVVISQGQELACQADDINGDSIEDQIVIVTDFKGLELKPVWIRYAKTGEKLKPYIKRTQAEISHKTGGRFSQRKYEGGQFQNVQSLRVPPEHTDHSFYIRYEGPGWESDKVGYRFYLDWRNAIDVFGKKTPDMVLQNTGLDGFESYHEMSDWGMDILKVGESLGLGSIGMWMGEKAERVASTDSVFCEIVSNGPVQSKIRTCYFGWKTGTRSFDLMSTLSISAGSRMTRHDLEIHGNPLNLCTGIVKLDSTRIVKVTGKSWYAFGTWGKQSLANDSLGMAVLVRNQDLLEMTGDPFSHVLVLYPEAGKLTYYFLAAWEKEPEGISTEEEFIRYLTDQVHNLDEPILVKYES